MERDFNKEMAVGQQPSAQFNSSQPNSSQYQHPQIPGAYQNITSSSVPFVPPPGAMKPQKSKRNLLIAIAVAAVLVITAALTLFFKNSGEQIPNSTGRTYSTEEFKAIFKDQEVGGRKDLVVELRRKFNFSTLDWNKETEWFISGARIRANSYIFIVNPNVNIENHLLETNKKLEKQIELMGDAPGKAELTFLNKEKNRLGYEYTVYHLHDVRGETSHEVTVCFMQVDNIGFLYIDAADEADVKADFNESADAYLAKLQN